MLSENNISMWAGIFPEYAVSFFKSA